MVVGPRELTLVAPSCRRMAFRRWSRGLECEYPGRRRETRGREVREGSDWARFDSQSPVTACRSLQTAKSASLQISGILLLRNADGHKKSHLVQQHGCVSDDAPRRVRGTAGESPALTCVRTAAASSRWVLSRSRARSAAEGGTARRGCRRLSVAGARPTRRDVRPRP